MNAWLPSNEEQRPDSGKQTEKALRASEDRFRRYFELGLIGMAITSPTKGCLEVNDEICRILGYERSELLRITWAEMTHPDDLAADVAHFNRVMAGEIDGYSMEKRFIRKDGQVIDASISVKCLRRADSSVDYFVGLLQDITERKLAEQRLREYEKVVEGLEEMIVVVDRNYRHLLANRAFLNYCGLEREQLVGRLVAKVLDKQVFENVVKKKLDECLQGRPIKYELRYFYPDRGDRDLLISYLPIEGPRGVDRVACVLQDITERKLAERKIEHFADLFQTLSHRLLHIQEEERRHLARELHDEIGQTLTAAKLNLKIIASDVPHGVADRIEDSIQLLDRLLQQVRQLSLDLRPPLLDELGLVPALRWLADEQTQRARLPVTFTTTEGDLAIESPMRTGCFRIAQEAITNAIRHAQATTVAVELRAEPDRVWLVVRDDGVGFETAAMQQRAAGGASVGLLSMNERASLLGGELEVNSAPGRGTEIRAWFPLAPREQNVIS